MLNEDGPHAAGLASVKAVGLFDSEERLVPLVSEYLTRGVQTANLAFASAETYGRNIGYLLEYLKGTSTFQNSSWDEILINVTQQGIARYFVHLREIEGLSSVTIRNRDGCYVALFNDFLCVGRNHQPALREDNPYAGGFISPSPKKSLIDPCSLNDLKALILSTNRERERALLQSIFDVGLRRSEVGRLTLGAVNDALNFARANFIGENEVEWVHPDYCPVFIEGSKGRGQELKERYSIVSKATLERIKRYHATPLYRKYARQYESADVTPCFFNSQGSPFNADAVSKLLERVSERAVKSKRLDRVISPHKLRHGHAYEIITSPDLGKTFLDGLVAAQMSLGHANSATTEKNYAQLPQELFRICHSSNGEIVTKASSMAALVSETALKIRLGDEKMSVYERALGSSRIYKWLEELEENPQGYYEVELCDNDSGIYAPLMLSASYIASKDLDPSLEIFELAEQKLILNMCIDGVIHSGETAAGCNWRLKLLGWYRNLSQEEKLKLPIFGNKLSLRRGLTLVPGLEGIQAHITRYPSVAIAYDEINQDLQRLGVVSNGYQTVKERREAKEEYIPQEPILVDFKRLRMKEFATLDDLERASEDKPFNDLKQAFAVASLKTTSDSGERNYLDAFNMVSRFFFERGLIGREPIAATLDAFILPRIHTHLEQMIITGDISPAFANTHLSAFRKTLTTIKNLKGYAGPDFINCQGFDADRVTDLYRPYTSSERRRISACVDEDILRNNLLAKPYELSGVGEDPVGSNGKLKPGYSTLENARWIFENRLNCKAVGSRTRSSSGDTYIDAFWSIVERSGVGLRDILESWGTHYLVDSKVIAPYAIKLGQVTGLNADSLRFLNLDDFEPKHRLTQRACLKYWKERSGGGKVMLLDLFDADITWLTTSQAEAVAKIFKDVEALTAEFRHAAPEKARKSLFIWQSSAPKEFLKVKSFATGKDGSVTTVFNSYAQRKGLVSDEGAPLNLTPARLRPSFISELVERGVPIREIQLILGHKHIKTTQAYLDRMDFNTVARGKLDVALRQIHERALAAADLTAAPNQGEPVTTNLIEVVQVGAPEVVFKTPLASCKNIFNPPEFVKRLSTYVPGRPCSMYNMCLGCENVLLTASNLPEIFAMERDYRKLVEVSRVMDTPYGQVVHENLSLLDNILGDKSDFTAEELSEGRRLAEFVDTTILIDGVGL